jgi:hypothetical protein
VPEVRSNAGIVLAVLVTGTVSFFLGLLLARVFPDGDSKPLSDLMIAAVGAGAGTAAGAMIAFRSDRIKREQEATDRAITAANLAMFQLGRLYSYLWDYKQSVLGPYETDPAIWYHVPRSTLTAPVFGIMDFSGLAFLFESEVPNILNSVALQFVRFDGFLKILDRASTLSKDARDLVASIKPADHTPEGFEKACGPSLTESLRETTAALIEFRNKLESDVLLVVSRMHSILWAMYPVGQSTFFLLPRNHR